MARRKFKKQRSHKWKPHVSLPLAACAANDAVYLYGVVKNGVTEVEAANLAYIYTGWNGSSVDFGRVMNTYGKYAFAGVLSWGATKIGLNKRLYKITGGYVGL